MDARTLNRDINRLARQWEFTRTCSRPLYNEEHDKTIKEYKRLIHVDRNFKYMNKKIMISLNESLRVIPLHSFGAFIKIEEL